ALLGFFAWIPFIVLSPFAGVWVDRLDRRWVMILASLGECVVTGAVLVLFFTGRLAIWHIYLLETCASLFDAFQAPAYTAATTTLLSKQEYARATVCVPWPATQRKLRRLLRRVPFCRGLGSAA